MVYLPGSYLPAGYLPVNYWPETGPAPSLNAHAAPQCRGKSTAAGRGGGKTTVVHGTGKTDVRLPG